MSSPRPLIKRRPPRPRAPFSKGLEDAISVPVKFSSDDVTFLRDRAKYETLRWRLAHNGKGREVSTQDIVRRLVAQFRAHVGTAIPNDAVGRLLREER